MGSRSFEKFLTDDQHETVEDQEELNYFMARYVTR